MDNQKWQKYLRIKTDKFFSSVYMRESLEHSIAPFIALCEVNRVLKPMGDLVVNVPDQNWLEWHCHYIVPTKEQLRALLHKTNFEIITEGTTSGGHIFMHCVKTNDIEL